MGQLNRRHDFKPSTKDILAKRTGYICSNPDCKKLTIGSHEDKNKSTTIGIAAHITAAAEGGERFDEDLSKQERIDIENGIWLCASCATLIDKDPDKYPVPLLQLWKKLAENESSDELRGLPRRAPKNTLPFLEADLTGWSRGRANKGVSHNNLTEMHEGQPVIVMTDSVIIFWHIWWRYTLVIHNNSSYPAYQVKVINEGSLRLAELGELPAVNNISPLSKVELTLRYEDTLECNYKIADAIKASRYPDCFKDLKLKITYTGDDRDIPLTTYVTFEDGELVNSKAY